MKLGTAKKKSKRKGEGEAGQLLQARGQSGKARQLSPFWDWDWEAMSHIGFQWIPESTTRSQMHTGVPMVLDFPLPQRGEGSTAIFCENTLHSLHFAHFPKGISHVIWGQRWPTGEAVETASPQSKHRGNDKESCREQRKEQHTCKKIHPF